VAAKKRIRRERKEVRMVLILNRATRYGVSLVLSLKFEEGLAAGMSGGRGWW